MMTRISLTHPAVVCLSLEVIPFHFVRMGVSHWLCVLDADASILDSIDVFAAPAG